MVEPVQSAVDVLRRGGVVAFPTETVYGLGADATDAAAVNRVFEIKGRPSTNPVIVHVADADVARRFASAWPMVATKLVEEFWPGPLTLVLPRTDAIVPAVTAGRNTVGLRSPDHPLTRCRPETRPSRRRGSAGAPRVAVRCRAGGRGWPG